MTQEQEIKGILVHFFREGTKGDYLDALNYAIKEIQQVKKCSIPDVMDRLPESDYIRQQAQQMDEKEFDQWWWETVYKGN